MLSANRKRQFQVRLLALDICDFYQLSYEIKHVRIISLKGAAILNYKESYFHSLAKYYLRMHQKDWFANFLTDYVV